jgi:hypothetical protein
MFRTSFTRLRARLETVDVLGDSPDDAQALEEDFFEHPHRSPLRWERERRAGSVQVRPAHCLCPVRPARARDTSREAELQ